MDLYPHDLGEWIKREIQQKRNGASADSADGPKLTAVGGTGLGGFALAVLFWSLDNAPLAVLMMAVTVFCAIWCGYLALTRLADAKSLKRPLSPQELKAIQERAGDKLLQSYVDLAHTVVSLPDTKDETANREVRGAIMALADAVEALPFWEWQQKTVADNPASLRTEAQTQLENAQAETDAVIAASLRRRAESLLRRADTAAKTLLLLRRNRALREEVGEQIKALRTSLTALQIGGRQSAPELSGLAASIHRVALEANAVTVARAEVDTLLSQPVRTVEAEPQAVRLRI